jgi:hypothetical protein
VLLLVIPREELAAEPACILNEADAVWVIPPIVHRFEVSFRRRVERWSGKANAFSKQREAENGLAIRKAPVLPPKTKSGADDAV